MVRFRVENCKGFAAVGTLHLDWLFMFRFQWFYPFPRLFLLTLPIVLRAFINIRPLDLRWE
jgi:membrane-bound metal-dependent hydrolase YbcI (DUF457 family)